MEPLKGPSMADMLGISGRRWRTYLVQDARGHWHEEPGTVAATPGAPANNGRKGGLARAASLSADERLAISQKASAAAARANKIKRYIRETEQRQKIVELNVQWAMLPVEERDAFLAAHRHEMDGSGLVRLDLDEVLLCDD